MFTQSSCNVAAASSIYFVACQDEFFVNSPLVVIGNSAHVTCRDLVVICLAFFDVV
jgi:hypothetical protein